MPNNDRDSPLAHGHLAIIETNLEDVYFNQSYTRNIQLTNTGKVPAIYQIKDSRVELAPGLIIINYDINHTLKLHPGGEESNSRNYPGV